MNEEDYVKRLEKIIDKQDKLISHLDAKFEQQDSLNNELSKQNLILREDIKKHKDLLLDMNKTVNQHKNVVKKLKKELEDQLKIQQDLHRDYGQVIKELTDDLEQYQQEDEKSNQNSDKVEKTNKVELPPKEHEKDYVSEASGVVYNLKDKSSNVIKELSESDDKRNDGNNQFCKNCGAKLNVGFLFCESCGQKVS